LTVNFKDIVGIPDWLMPPESERLVILSDISAEYIINIMRAVYTTTLQKNKRDTTVSTFVY
jgi:hypothetical protein